jgi:hypothetical protein
MHVLPMVKDKAQLRSIRRDTRARSEIMMGCIAQTHGHRIKESLKDVKVVEGPPLATRD